MTLRRAVGLLFVLAAFLFLALFVSRDLGDLRAYPWEVRPLQLAASLALHIAGLFVGVAAWRLLLANLGYPVAYKSLARVWFISGLGRYIPGKVWQFVGAAHLGAGTGLPALVTVTSLAAHTFIFLVAAVLVGAYLVPMEALGAAPEVALAVRALAPLLLFALHPIVIRSALHLLRRASGRDLGEWSGSWGTALRVVGIAALAWILTGSALFLFVAALVPLDVGAAPALVGMNALAFAAGYLVFVAPAGLGAKEGALAGLLSIYVPVSVAALIAVAARLWTVAAEVLPALALVRARPPSPSPPPAAGPAPGP